VGAKIKKSLAISQKTAQDFDVERFNNKQLSEPEFRKQYNITV
jgi:hypothetical protein